MPTKSKVFLRCLLNMREKQILTSVIEIQKRKLGVTTHFSKLINKQLLDEVFVITRIIKVQG